MTSKGSFFPMPGPERAALFGLILFSAVAFLPVFGRITVLGVAVFGWLMAALLLGSPAILLMLLLSGPGGRSGPKAARVEEGPGEP